MFPVALLCIEYAFVMKGTHHGIYLLYRPKKHLGLHAKGNSRRTPALFIHAANLSPGKLVLSPAARLDAFNVS
jgi:hypothetical protein